VIDVGAGPALIQTGIVERDVPPGPPGDVGLVEWSRGIDAAADAWRPELERLIERLDLAPGSVVLDAGCGSGRITGWLAERVVPDGLVTGVDLDLAKLEYAAFSLQPLGALGGQIELWQGDVTHLPFPDSTFDAAWCSSVLGYVHDPVQALTELVRVVRPGGRIAVVSGDAERSTFLPIDPDLERRLRAAETTALRNGAWGPSIDIHLGRRLYALARALPVRSVEPMSLTWERAAPLTDVERAFLGATLAWLVDPAVRSWLGPDWEEARRLFDPAGPDYVLARPDLHVLQTACAVVITV
jgi:SAM-dependent methyltransferase